MDIVISGVHGNIAMLMHPLLKERGHNVQGLIRDEDQAYDLEQAGAEPILADLEKMILRTWFKERLTDEIICDGRL